MKIFLIICNNFVKVLMDMRNIQKNKIYTFKITEQITYTSVGAKGDFDLPQKKIC